MNFLKQKTPTFLRRKKTILVGQKFKKKYKGILEQRKILFVIQVEYPKLDDKHERMLCFFCKPDANISACVQKARGQPFLCCSRAGISRLACNRRV